MTKTEQSIIRAIAYFNIFSYPLRKDEIFQFMDAIPEKDRFEKSLLSLLKEGLVFRIDEFYCLQQNPGLITRRRAGNKMAVSQLKIASRISRFLYYFPFVRGIGVSGSLSKNFADINSDIDFFIITARNRVWISRTFMHVFKKLTFLIGRQHWYCMNYYIDEKALQIKERNIFTAVELMTLLPLQDNGVFADLLLANQWAKSFLPAYTTRHPEMTPFRKYHFKSMLEWLFNNKLGDKFNHLLMTFTVRRWNKKKHQQKRSVSGELMALDANVHYAKPDPANFQRKILTRYENDIAELLSTGEKLIAH